MQKVAKINASNYGSSDDVEVAIMSKKEESAVKLAQAKDTAKEYDLKNARNIILGQQQDPVFASFLKEGNRADTAIIILEEFSKKKHNSAIVTMAKATSMGFGRDDTSTTKASYSTWRNATKALNKVIS